MIETLGFAGYFLVVWEITQFCKRENILCQGRGSAANSAVCYALGITNADAVRLGLLFERFLSPERDGPPDIDIDIESERREEVIQHVYARYGRHHTAQVANVITYRAKSAVRDMAKALGFAPGQQDAWSKQLDAWGDLSSPANRAGHEIPDHVIALAREIEDAPRHLGIHSGGMVICDRPVVEVCPVEWARMDKRSVLQWDKDDCAATGLVKFDLLGLGMLDALHRCIDLVREHRGYQVDLANMPQDDDVYEMLCKADTVGVFQIESRAQMATLPRLRPREFYDLVVEVALIRPGPIQGGSVHPYIRRRNGHEEVTYLHPLLENSLRKTLGVPLFQEQLMQMAIDVAGFTPAEADELRQAMGSKRSRQRMERLRQRLYDGMAERGITGEIADELFTKMAAFANYGFPESHSVSFAYLVYSSSWLKYYEPAAFCAALINAQPMGFWSPHTLTQDARRHGVVVRTPDLNASLALATLEPCPSSTGGVAVRLGIGSVRGIGSDLAKEIEAGRPYSSIEALVRAVPALSLAQLEAMATAGLFGECFGLARREALWAVGAAVQSRPGRLPGIVVGTTSPSLPGMTPVEESVADLWATGVSPERPPHPLPAHVAGRTGRRHVEGLVGRRATVAGADRRRGHPPPAADDRPGRDVPQPGGRDRADQRRRLQGLLGALPQGRPRCPGDADPWPHGTQRGGDQRRGRRADGPAGAGEQRQPRLQMTPAGRRRRGDDGGMVTMRAWRVDELGHPSTSLDLQDVGVPEPGPGEARVRVEAVNVNFADILLCQGIYQDRPGVPFTPGLETTGTVEEVGPGVTLEVGTRIAGMAALPSGGYAQSALVRAGSALVVPDDVPAPVATVLYSTYQTAHVGLHHRAGLRPGEWLLVHGASSGVGAAAVQLGVAAGAKVIATATGARKADACRALGATEVLDLERADVRAEVLRITADHGVDVAYDPVGGELGDLTRRLMAWEGRLLVIGFAAGTPPSYPANHILVKNYSVLGLHWAAYSTHGGRAVIEAAHDDLLRLYRSGDVAPEITTLDGLEQVPAALAMLEARQVTGRLVVVP